VVTRFIRLHPGAQKGNAANYWSLFEPHYKQNLYANPKRTAKFSFYISDARDLTFVQIIFSTLGKIFSLKEHQLHFQQLFIVRIEKQARQAAPAFREKKYENNLLMVFCRPWKNAESWRNPAVGNGDRARPGRGETRRSRRLSSSRSRVPDLALGHHPNRRALSSALACFAMRAIWKGSISFSLINIPIALYPATRREELKFRLLRASDLSPVNYKRVSEADGKEVPWDQIVKGYEYEKGKFVVLKEEDFKRADIEATQSVDIQDFVELDEIDPIFFDRPYYLEPEKRGEKAYGLLREALKQSGKVGIAKVVIKTRQHLAAVKPEKSLLVLELMHFAEEIIDTKELKIPHNPAIGAKELEMARDLIGKMSGKWEPEKYQDDYRHALLEAIQQKVESGGKKMHARGKARKPTNVVDLVSVLQESLQHAEKGKTAKRKPPAHHKRKLKKAA
jgi:DNA end-binding protein Ku